MKLLRSLLMATFSLLLVASATAEKQCSSAELGLKLGEAVKIIKIALEKKFNKEFSFELVQAFEPEFVKSGEVAGWKSFFPGSSLYVFLVAVDNKKADPDIYVFDPANEQVIAKGENDIPEIDFAVAELEDSMKLAVMVRVSSKSACAAGLVVRVTQD